MNYFTSLALALFLTISLAAQPPAGKAKPGDHYGVKIMEAGAIPVAELPALLEAKDTVNVKITAKALSSCASKGCWMTLDLGNGESAFVKMKDYGFFVPTAIAGKTVVLEGIAFKRVTTVEELKHYAEDAKKPQAEIDAITQPKTEIRFLADGILVIK